METDTGLAELFRDHYTPLLRAAWLLLRDRAAAEDVVQEAFLRMHRRRLREPDRAAGYLRTTVVNLARGRLRHLAVAERHQERPSDRSQAVDQGDDRRLVLAALDELPTRQRECMVLRYYLDLSERDIAEALGISTGSVKTHVHRAMTALESSLENVR